ncbi:hypothetical protein [Bordetella bronchiseptica]|uniref:hypothetical protein n=1 Tax=Bordetella bronchiseptica TaxID=518 RepID=UPI0012480DEC|nr:hypothetical protein [Bordetella bronchiseptica]KAB1448546.1 hypothetical protein F7D00_08420 [Bordetella bronchiseptica]KAB1574868.1 hypothetical protein F7890_08420 [Bordetella bronchiseptica]
MSLARSMGSPDAQAASLVAFLAQAQHQLSLDTARTVCAALPRDNKLAAKQLKQALAGLSIPLKHTHALKAIAQLRGAPGHLGLGDATRWEIASWIQRAPAVSPRREVLQDLGQACDQLCARIREQFDPGTAPFVHLHITEQAVEIEAMGEPSHAWRAIILAISPEHEPRIFDMDQQIRLTERLRRLIEGELGGWLDGVVSLDAAQDRGAEIALSINGQTVAAGTEAPVLAHLETRITDLPHVGNDMPLVDAQHQRLALIVRRIGQPEGPMRATAWRSLHARYRAFVRRHERDFAAWWEQRHDEGMQEQFAPEPLVVEAVEAAQVRRGISDATLAERLRLSVDAWKEYMHARTLPVALFPVLAQVLGLASENELLGAENDMVRIPLPRHEDIGMFLSRFEIVEVVPQEGAAALAQQLARQCEADFARRRHWDTQVPAGLIELNHLIRHEGWGLTCAMEKRFVQDLPLNYSRMGIVLTLRFDKAIDVHTQHGQLPVGNSVMQLPPEEEHITEEWLARFNASAFTGEDIQRYTDKVSEMRGPDDTSKDRFEITMIAGVKVFKSNPQKAHAASVRMESFAHLLERCNLTPWVMRSTDPEASMLSKPVFEAIARCPLVDVNSKAGFEEQAFRRLLVEYARTWEH